MLGICWASMGACFGQAFERWSEPSTWGGDVPVAGSSVTIPAGKTVLLDTETAPLDGLMIHGTHRPAGVGMRVSQGCIRLYPESISNLIGRVPVGTEVRIVDQPARLGWRSGRLYLEVDPAGDAPSDRHPDAVWASIEQRLEAARTGAGARIDRPAATAAFERADGIPVVVGRVLAIPGNETAGQAPGG